MPISINQAQKGALTENFFDSLGSDEVFQPRESLNALARIAGELIQDAQNNLAKRAKTGTGALADSFTIENPEQIGNTVTLDIYAASYWDYVNSGVKGTKSGSGKYQFKNEFVGTDMLNSIKAWMKQGGIKTANVKFKKWSVGKLEKKNKSISKIQSAYAVARSIKQNGIKGTGFFDKALRNAERKINKELGAALAIDIIRSLPKNLKDV